MINLVTSFFNILGDTNEIKERNNEYNFALMKNLESEYIKKIHLFVDNNHSINVLNNIINDNTYYKQKIVIISYEKQAFYNDFFLYSNENLVGEVVMISNSDIYIYECNNKLLEKYIVDNEYVFALTRHENIDYKPLIDDYRRYASHDSFIFKSPLKDDIHMRSNFRQNNWGSENLVISLFANNGYQLFNPCYQFKIIHCHKSDYRNDNRVRINDTNTLSDYMILFIDPITLDF